MKHAKKLMAALFAVVMLIAMTACSPQMTLEQKMQKALDNMNGMKNADADMNMEIEMGMMGMTVSMQMKGNIVTFTDPVKMKMNMTLNALGQEQSMDMYAQQTEDGITTYANAAGTGWQVQQLSSEEFAEQYSSSMNGSADVFLKAMKDFTQAEGTEEINGRKTIKVEGVINGADIAEALKASGMMDAMGSEMGAADLDMEQLEEMTQDMSGMKITMWLDDAKYVPVKFEMDMTEMMNALVGKAMEGIDSGEETGVDLNMQISKCRAEVTYNKINDAEDFTIPQEALDAAK